MSSCEWQMCRKMNILKLPRRSSPKIRSSNFEFTKLQMHEWRHRALHDNDVRFAMENGECCFKRNSPTTLEFPHTCFLADADHNVKLPDECTHANNEELCMCMMDSLPNLYCDGLLVQGQMSKGCDKQAIGYEVECNRSKKVVARTNTVKLNIPGGCSLESHN
jgi:hypothetical protein|eukprot:6399961-Prymnesium_polylepis.2